MKRNQKGFTLAELLIVIAIIAVLVAIMIPVFGAQLDRARFAADVANVRAVYAEQLANAMMNSDLTSEATGVSLVKETIETELKANKWNKSTVTIKSGDRTNKGEIVVTKGSNTISIVVDEDVTFVSENAPITGVVTLSLD